MRRNEAMPGAAFRGMTLIEITLALLIAALVGAYSVPAYREYLARGHRQAAVEALHACALQLEAGESGYAMHGPRAPGAGIDSETTGTCASVTSAYRISVSGAGAGVLRSASTYVIEATPQPRGPQRADRCGIFTLDAQGRRGNRSAAAYGGRAFEGCWSGMRR